MLIYPCFLIGVIPFKRLYINENPLEASVEKKLYLNFAKWLKYVFVDGKPTTRQWVDIMQSQTPELSPPSIPEEYYAGGDSSSPIVLD